MLYTGRDLGIRRIDVREKHSCYGMGLGVIILDEAYPGFPGDVRNASGYPFPIQYEIVRGVDIEGLVWDPSKRDQCLAPIKEAARNLEKMGCRAIIAECGYFAYFQKEIAAAVNVPCFLSSLLQTSFAQQVIGPDKVVGLLVASKKNLTNAHLEAVGIRIGSNYVIESANEDGKVIDFDKLWHKWAREEGEGPHAIYERAEEQFIKVASEFYQAHPNMGAMVLECTGYPPFARALQRRINIPLFSFGTLMDYAYSVVVHRDYYGHV